MAAQRHEVLIIGSGLAGLTLALKLADEVPVTILAKAPLEGTNTTWAQGGIAAVMSPDDSFDTHIQDTLIAGAGLCDVDAVRKIVEQAPSRVQELMDWGVQFDRLGDHINLTREGGHSFRRILHHEDQTGKHVHATLVQRVKQNPRIQILENRFAVDLIVNKQADPTVMGPTECIGVYVLNKQTEDVETHLAKQVVLATGGAGKVYLYTSNWSGATGDGIAMAYRAGARIENLEFMQFHPTCLYHKDARNFLISEALRGEGGELINQSGEAFMKKYHPLGSLAPRDIVARGIDAEIKKSGHPCVYLDMTKLDPTFLHARFPAIDQKCREYGIDMTKDPIPVVPAAHYLCGGVKTDIDGQTDIPGLWAIGETACTGLHGANRLASNSLLECLAMAHGCSEKILPLLRTQKQFAKIPPAWIHPLKTDSDEMVVIHHMWDEIRQLMWNYVGIVRSNKRLVRAQHRLKNILAEVKEYYSDFHMNPDILELRNIALVADLTVECAIHRHESRGIHYNLDYPFSTSEEDKLTPAKPSVLLRGIEPGASL